MASGKTLKTTITLYGKQDASLKRAFQAAQGSGAQAAEKLSGVFKKAAAVASAAFAAIKVGDFMKDAMETYETFEQSMANTAAIAGASAEDYELLSKAARDAGKATAFEASEAADALGYMALAGWDAKTSTQALMPVLKMAEATQADLATTSDLVTDSMSAMGLQVEDLSDYMDVLITTNNKANTTAADLMEAMIGAGGAMRAAGIDVKDTATAFGMLANNGVKGSQAGTALNSMVARLTTHSKALGTAAKLGVDIFDQQTGQFRGLETVLTELNSALSQYSQEQQLAFKKQLAGANYFSQFGYLLDSVKQGYYDLGAAQEAMTARGLDASKLMSQMPQIFGNMDEAAKKAMESIGAMYKYEDSDELLDTETILKQIAAGLYDYSDAEREAYLQAIAGQEHYEELKGVIDSMYDTLDTNTSAWGKLRNEVEDSGGSLEDMWKTATDTLSYAKSVWNSAVSDFKIGIAEAFGPKLKSILNKASARFPQVTENVSKLIEGIPFDEWSDKLGGMTEGLFDFFDSVTSEKGIFESLSNAIGGVMATNADGQLFGNWDLKNKIQDVKDFGKSVDESFGQAWDKIKEVGGWLKDEFLKTVDTVKESFEKHGPTLEELKRLGDNLKKTADEMFGGAQEAVDDLNESSLPTLTDTLAKVVDKAVEVLNAFLEWKGAIPTITTIATAVAGIKIGTAAIASVKALAAAFGFLKAQIIGANITGQFAALGSSIGGALTTAQTAIYVWWTDTMLPFLASMGSSISGAFASAGAFMTADIGSTVAAGGAAAGGTIAAAILGGVVAALGGLEVGKKVGALIFPDDADLYESYSGLSGTWQLMKDTASAAWDGIVMLVEAAGGKLKEVWEDIKTVAGDVWDAVNTTVQNAVDDITAVVEGAQTIFTNIIDFIKNVFTGEWEAAWKNVVSIFDTVFSGVKDIANKVIGGVVGFINSVIRGINAAGKVAGLDPIQEITYTALAKGATVTRPTYALIGEAGYPETVVPHTNTARSRALLSEATAGVYGGRQTTGSSISVTYAPVINGASGDVGRQLKTSFSEFKTYFERLIEEQKREAFA